MKNNNIFPSSLFSTFNIRKYNNQHKIKLVNTMNTIKYNVLKRHIIIKNIKEQSYSCWIVLIVSAVDYMIEGGRSAGQAAVNLHIV